MERSLRIAKVDQSLTQLFKLSTPSLLKKQLLYWYLQNSVETSLFSSDSLEQRAQKDLPEEEFIKNKQDNRLKGTSYKEASFKSKGTKREMVSAKNLNELLDEINNFKECSLKKTAKNLVFADGNPHSKVMLLGEAPGEEEDQTGIPFVGDAGKLLDKMLASIGQNRDNTYLTNIIFWRPPGNRNPTIEEINLCLPYVLKHIEIIQPKILILAGSIASRTILKNHDKGITQLRGKWYKLNIGQNNLNVNAMPIFHPTFLLRQPSRKREAWEDLKNIKEAIGKL